MPYKAINMAIIKFKGPEYFSQGDERALFEWLTRLKCVREVGGTGPYTEIRLRRSRLSNDDFRELLAIFHRYGIDKRVLRPFARKEMKWVWNRTAYWYHGLFETK